jgi:hypothetical protein
MEAEDQSVVEVVLRLQGPWIVDKDFTGNATTDGRLAKTALKHDASTGSQWPAFETEPSGALQRHARAGAIRCDGPVRSYVDTLRCARGPPRRLEAGRNSLDHHDQDLTYLRLPRRTNLTHYTCALASTDLVVEELAPATNVMPGKERKGAHKHQPERSGGPSCGDQGTRWSANRC